MVDALTSFREGLKTTVCEHHQDIRETVAGLDADALNWRPGPETNSLAVLVIHTLAVEQFCLLNALGEVMDRDRPAEFRTVAGGPDELIAEIDRIDALLPGMIDRVTAEDLEAMRTPPNDRANRTRSGMWWLLHGVRHAREHIGQMFVTRQLYEQQVLGK